MKDFAEPQLAPLPEEIAESSSVKISVQEKPGPQRKRRERPIKPRPAVVNIEWTEPDSMGAGFLLWTFIFIVICALVIAIAIYLK